MTKWIVSSLRALANKLDNEKSLDPVEDAVKQAFADVGLPLEQYGTTYDLVHAGKLTDVYHTAARKLNIDPELNTVGDVIKWLKS